MGAGSALLRAGAAVASVVITVVHTWARWASAAAGVWLMAAPAVFEYGGFPSAFHRVVGPVAAAFAFIAVWQHMRPLRWLNVFFGGLLLLAPWPLAFGPAATLNSLVVGLVLVSLAFVRGPGEAQFGGGWSAVWTGDGSPEREYERPG